VTRGISNPHGWARATTVALAAGAALLAVTGTASAHPSDNPAKSAGTVRPNVIGDHATASVPDGEKGRVFGTMNGKPLVSPTGLPGSPTGRIFIDFNKGSKDPATGHPVLSYCIDLGHELGDPNNPYTEVPFAQTGLADEARGKILWILAHSKPNVADADVLRMAKVTGVASPDASAIVYTATQAAIWHFSDAFEMGDNDATRGGAFSDAQYANMRKVYGFLIASATTQNGAPTLSITPPSAQGMVNDLLGPFTVHTNAPEITLTATNGATLLGADKTTPVTSVTDGQTFFVKPGTAGTATVTGTGMGSVAVGRAFVVLPAAITPKTAPDSLPQKLLLANLTPQQVKVTVSVMAATPTPTPTPTPTTATPTPTSPALAATGASPMPKVGLAVVLLAVGTGLTFLARRRRRGSHA
jgi:TQXA domain-containing protein